MSSKFTQILTGATDSINVSASNTSVPTAEFAFCAHLLLPPLERLSMTTLQLPTTILSSKQRLIVLIWLCFMVTRSLFTAT